MSLNSSLELYIMPCGGAVDIEVTLNGEIVKSKRHIVGFGRIVIPDPPIASRYYIRVLAANYEELRKTSGVEVTITLVQLYIFNLLQHFCRFMLLQSHLSTSLCQTSH